uniref:Cytochrome c oxidase subunit 3 n=1 Tax=Oopsacas minuta TaxID=111878 RepID=A0A0N7ALF5_9METZ|nr:cytochrome c oxidase subunit 3 [Oopsacas minuta]
MKKYHPYHLVEPSPWPIIGGCGALFLTTGSILFFHFTHKSIIIIGSLTTIIMMIAWWRDVIRESSFQGLHTIKVQTGLKEGMILFISSEVLFFFSFFWAFFHSSLAPTTEIGSNWPPEGIQPLNPIAIPLLNTLVLLSSGITITWTHNSLIKGSKKNATKSLTLTILLGIFFTYLQILEYSNSSFTISDSIYGSTFFVATGFHGAHVLIGTTFLLICRLRLNYNHFTTNHHIGFETSAWYWHFVDVVWLFLYTCIYWWGC